MDIPQLVRRARTVVHSRTGWFASALFLSFVIVLFQPTLRFLAGGALVNAGYKLQDPLRSSEHATPSEVLEDVLAHNALASKVREAFPRSVYHPTVAVVVCMDARLDTSELVGDTRRSYYVLRLAGSVMSAREEEMLELAVANGVRVVVHTTHTDCAAERVSSDPKLSLIYPALTAGVLGREHALTSFAARPRIQERIASGQLLVREALINTDTGKMTIRVP